MRGQLLKTAGRAALCLAFATVYVLAARGGLALDAVSGFATLVWPPTGLSLLVLLLGGTWLWPGVALGATFVNASIGAPWPVACGIGVGNTLEVIGAVWALRRLGFRTAIDSVRDGLLFIGIAAVATTLVAAAIGVGSLVAGGVVPWTRAGVTFRAWWMGDGISALVIAPLPLVWRAPRAEPRAGRRVVEGLALAATLLATAVFVFARAAKPIPEAYLAFPTLTWATLRFGQRGATACSFVVAAVAIASTIAGRGPFAHANVVEALFSLQLFMTVVAGTFLLLGAAMEERRRAFAALQAAVSARDSFLSLASHELRTPLTAVQLQVGRMVRRSLGDTSALALLSRQVERLSRLVSTLLDVSRLQSGRLALELEPVDLGAAVREAVARFFDEHGRDYPLSVSAGDEIVGHWDRQRIDQITGNLLTNAFKYGAGKPIVVRVHADDAMAHVTVRDEGEGIAAADQQRIFERFERATAPSRIGGFGLGLWIVRESAQALGGQVLVDSQPGRGATFVVSLPRRRPASPG